MEKIIELTKEALNNENKIEELKREVEKELKPTGKLTKLNELLNNNELDMEKYEFMMRLITNDKELYEQLNKLKKLKEIKQNETDLETLKTNFNATKEEIIRQIESLKTSINSKTSIPVIKDIAKKIRGRKNKEILKAKLDQIIKTIEQSKLKTENKNLKEEYSNKVILKETLDLLYKNCEMQNVEDIINSENIIREKYETIFDELENDINKVSQRYKSNRKQTENYDQRLKEYTYNKKNNYVTTAIDKLSKKEYVNYDKESKELKISQPEENYELLVYPLIALYLTKKPENHSIKFTYISKNIKNSALTKNSIVNTKIESKDKLNIYHKSKK